MGMVIANFNTLQKSKKYLGSCCNNKFVIVDCRGLNVDKKSKSDFASKFIRKHEVDSAIFLEKSNCMNVLVEIFEKYGSESESFGNVTLLIAKLLGLKHGKVEMKDNAALVNGNSKKQSVSMNIKFSEVRRINNGEKNCIYVKMGEPHLVYLVNNIKKINLLKIGKKIQKKYPRGVNVDAIQKLDETHYLIRTYERGVFAETSSCGTGSLSAYMTISRLGGKTSGRSIEFKSSGGIHWVSQNKNMLKLETYKSYCKIKSL